MATTDYNKLKKISPTSQNDSGATINKAQPVLVLGEGEILDDFEDGVDTGWTGDTGALTAQSSTVITGSQSGEFTASNSLLEILSPSTSKNINIATTKIRIGQDVGDGGDHFNISPKDDATGDIITVSFIDGNNGVDIRESGVVIDDNIQSWSANTTYEVRIEVDSTNDKAFVYIDGTEYGPYDISVNDNGIETISFENDTNDSGATRDIFIDDVGLNNGLTEANTGTGDIVLDWTNISSESDIAVYDQDGNLLNYEIESFDATNETATLWAYNSWVRDDTVQAQVVYGDGQITEDITVKEVDGFEDGDFSSSPTWTEEVTNGTATVQSTVAEEDSNALEINTSSSTDHALNHDRGTSDSVSDNDVYQVWMRVESGNVARFGLSNTQGSLSGDNSANDAVTIELRDSTFQAITTDGSSNTIATKTFGNGGAGEWFRFEIEIVPSSSTADFRVYNTANVLVDELTGISTSGAANLQHAVIRKPSFSNAGNIYYDDVSYSTTDQTLTIDSNEQNVTGTWDNTGQNAFFVHHLQEDSTPFLDSTSNSNDSTSVTGTTAVSGQFDGARSFDGTDDIATLGDIGLGTPSNITIVSWLKPENDITSKSIIQNDWASTQNKWLQSIAENNNNEPRLALNDGSIRFFDYGTTITTGEYNQVVGIGDSSNNNLKGYVDGSEASNSPSGSFGGITSGTEDVAFGAQSDNTAHIEADLDELRLYTDVKDSAWIQADYDSSPKAGQVFFSQQAAEQNVTDKTASVPETQLTSSNPDPQVNAFNTVTIQETTVTTDNPAPQLQPGTATVTVTETQLTSTNPDINLTPGAATIQAQNPTNLAVDNPDFQINSVIDVTVPETTLTTNNPNPSIIEGQTILAPETNLVQTTPDIQLSPGTSTVQVLETQLTASNPQISLNRRIVFGTVTQLTSSNPEPSLDPGIVQVNVPETKLTQTTENPGVSPGETTLQITPPTQLLVSNPTISLTGGPTSIGVDPTELTVTNPDTSVAIKITPRDQTKSFNIDKSEKVTVSGDIDK